MRAVELSDSAKGSKREMTEVLYQKFAYSGGNPERAKQLAQPRHAPQIQVSFVDMYNLIMDDKSVDPDKVFATLSSTMDVYNLHPKILAVAQFLVDKHSIRDPSQFSLDDLRFWMTSTIIWSKLLKALPKEPAPSFEAQIRDVFRYIVMIINYRKP
jgi:hypothetical protein